jgi:hypothetical protein
MGTSKLSSGVLLESMLMPWRLRLRALFWRVNGD